MDASVKVEILRASCCVAGADGGSSDPENQILKKLAKEIGVGSASLGAMIDRAETDPDFHRQQFEILKAEPTSTMAILFQVALSDGVLTDDELLVLKNLADNLEVPAEVFQQLHEAASRSLG